jgi:hypothetical protein
VARGERAVKSGGRPCANGSDAKENYRRVWTWFAGRWRNHQLKRAEKPHSKFSDREALDGPATRPKTPLAVENGVGNPAAFERRRLMPVGKERLANSHPPFVPVRPKGRAGT